MNSSNTPISVGELVIRFVEACGTRAAFGVISLHNMPMLDAIHRRGHLRFVSSRGEAGACNMADAYARVTGGLGVCITSTGTGAGNAAGALVEALTAGTPLLHLTGQIESKYLDRDLGYIHEAPAQLAMLQAVGKASFRIRNPETALATLREAVRIALTPPCGPVSIEIPIDVQAMMMPAPLDCMPVPGPVAQPLAEQVDELARLLQGARRPLLWLGGGARGASAAVERLVKLGWGVVTSVQGRGVLAESHPASLGAFTVQTATEAFYQGVDAMLVVGSRLRSNETLNYRLKLPARRFRIDANALADNRGYESDYFVQGDALRTLHALADRLEGRMSIDPGFIADLGQARTAAHAQVDAALGPYKVLKDELSALVSGNCHWVRDITLSNSMWGNRCLTIDDPRAGVHALGGGIGQGLAMGIGAAVADAAHGLNRRTVVLSGDGGFMLNVGELACAAQEKAQMVVLLMNDSRYGVIRNIQDEFYGSRHCYVDLHNPDFATFCASLKVSHLLLSSPEQTRAVLERAFGLAGPVVVEVDMARYGSFAGRFAGPPLKKD